MRTPEEVALRNLVAEYINAVDHRGAFDMCGSASLVAQWDAKARALLSDLRREIEEGKP